LRTLNFYDTSIASDIFSIPFKELLFLDSITGTDTFSLPWYEEKSFVDSGLGSDLFTIPFRSIKFIDSAYGLDAFKIIYRLLKFEDTAYALDKFILFFEKAFTLPALGTDIFVKEIPVVGFPFLIICIPFEPIHIKTIEREFIKILYKAFDKIVIRVEERGE